MIYTHMLNKGGRGVRSPIDVLGVCSAYMAGALPSISPAEPGRWIAYDQAVAAYAPERGVIGGNLAWEIDRAQDTRICFFMGLGPASSVALAAFANATFEALPVSPIRHCLSR
jgi:hypothetical protein